MSKRYIIGDIHGSYTKLIKLIDLIAKDIHPKNDKLIFLGDYVSYGDDSYKVIDFLIALKKQMTSVFLLGDHDHAFLDFIKNPNNKMSYLEEMEGHKTLSSYERELGRLYVPEEHIQFIQSLKLTHEEQDFFCVHAGLNPDRSNIREQKIEDLLTIKEDFFLSKRVWKKLIIFGHTNVEQLHDKKNQPYFNRYNNILGLDTGCGTGGRLSCYEAVEQKFYQI